MSESQKTQQEKRSILIDYMNASRNLRDAQAKFDPLSQKVLSLIRQEQDVLSFDADGETFIALYKGGVVSIKKLNILDYDE